MSKQKRGRPEAQSPEPPEIDQATTGISETPEAAKASPQAVAIPPVPAFVRAMARVVESKWRVPQWLTILAAWTGSKFGAEMPGTNNAVGMIAAGTMQRNAEGYAWFGKLPFAYDQFGYLCARKLALDYSDPAACIAALKPRCPNIDAIKHDTFKEA